MYLYLYDAQLSGKPFQHALVRVETRLTDLGIGGKISRLSPLKNLRELIHDEVACDVIAARRLSRLDIGRANTTYFLSGLRVPFNQASFELDGQYHVKPNAGSFTVLIRNLPPEGWSA